MSFYTKDHSYDLRYGRIAWTVAAVIAVIAVFIATLAYVNEERKTDRGRGDSGITEIDRTDAHVYEMPDEFGGLASKCVADGWRGFTTTNDGGAFAVPDESCRDPFG